MRKLLLSVLLCSALVMGLLPAAAFATELGNTPESVEEAPTSALEEQTVNEELLSEYGEQKNAPGKRIRQHRMLLRRSMSAAPVTTNRIPAQKISLSPRWLRRSMPRLTVQRSIS